MININEVYSTLGAGLPALEIICPLCDEKDILQEISLEIGGRFRGILTWDPLNRLRTYPGKEAVEIPDAPGHPWLALGKHILGLTKDDSQLIFIKDAPVYLQSDEILKRSCKEVLEAGKTSKNKLVFLHQGDYSIPSQFRDYIWSVDCRLPNEQEILGIVQADINNVLLLSRANITAEELCPEPTLKALVRSLQGQTKIGVQHLLMNTLTRHLKQGIRPLDEEALRDTLEAKKMILRTQGIIFAPPPQIDICGMPNLLAWAQRSKKLLDQEARKQHNLPRPPNLLMIGVPGTGKSLSVKAIAQSWGVPCIQMDLGSILDYKLGASEGNLLEVLRRVGACAPCILWIDEMDKQFSVGAGSDGTLSRMLGTFLSWLTECPEDVIVIGTANNPEGFSGEFLRRFKKFHVGLPDRDTLKAIWVTMLRHYQIELSNADINSLAGSSEGRVGSEIEAMVQEAATIAFAEGRPREVSYEALLQQLKATIPQFQGAAHTRALEQWAHSNGAITV